LLQGVKHVGILDETGSVSKNDYKNVVSEKRMDSWKSKQMHGQFIRDMPDSIDKTKSWEWLTKSDLKVPTEALVCAAQEQAIRTNYIKYHIDKSVQSPMCRLCGERGETISHIISECKKLAQK